MAKYKKVPISTARGELFKLAELVRQIYIPALVLVELAEAMRRGVLRADDGFSRWSDQLLASRHFVVADLTAAIVSEAEGLYSIPARGDRLIAATASHLGCPLLTNDPAIARIPTVATLW